MTTKSLEKLELNSPPQMKTRTYLRKLMSWKNNLSKVSFDKTLVKRSAKLSFVFTCRGTKTLLSRNTFTQCCRVSMCFSFDLNAVLLVLIACLTMYKKAWWCCNKIHSYGLITQNRTASLDSVQSATSRLLTNDSKLNPHDAGESYSCYLTSSTFPHV